MYLKSEHIWDNLSGSKDSPLVLRLYDVLSISEREFPSESGEVKMI